MLVLERLLLKREEVCWGGGGERGEENLLQDVMMMTQYKTRIWGCVVVCLTVQLK